MGLGLRDVHQLAWKLADVLGGAAGEEILDSYQAEREPHARALIRVALLLGRLMTGGGRGGNAVRRAVLAIARRIPAVARLATDSRTPPLRSGPLVDRRGRAGRRLAGTLVPRPEVVVDGRRRRLDDVLGPGSAELARADGGLVVRSHGRQVPIEDPSGAVSRWLGRATGVRIRPDRIVGAARGRVHEYRSGPEIGARVRPCAIRRVGSPDGGRAAGMNIDKDQILQLLRSQGDDAKAQQADQELPSQVDTDRDAGLLSKFGIDPMDLVKKLGGGGGGLGGLLGG
jgi:hypothetical protein